MSSTPRHRRLRPFHPGQAVSFGIQGGIASKVRWLMEQFWFLIGALKVDADELIPSLLFADADPLVALKI